MAPKIRVNATFIPDAESWDPDRATGLTEEAENGIRTTLENDGLGEVEFVREGD